MGFPVRLGVASVSGGPTPGTAEDWEVAVQTLAGPLVTIGLMVLSVIGLRRRKMSSWAFALAITAPLRFLVGAVFLFYVAKASLENSRFSGQPNFDEYNAALALGLSPVWLIAGQTLLLIGFWIWIAGLPVARRRLASVASALMGGAVGISLWMTAVGPAVVSNA